MRPQWSFIENRGKVRRSAWSSKLSAAWSRAFPSVSTCAADWNSRGRCFEDHVYLNGRLIAREVDRWNGHSSSVSTNEWSNLRLRSKRGVPLAIHVLAHDKRASFTVPYIVNTFIFAVEVLLKRENIFRGKMYRVDVCISEFIKTVQFLHIVNLVKNCSYTKKQGRLDKFLDSFEIVYLIK